MIPRYVAAVLATTWIFWQIPFAATTSVRLPELTAAVRLENAAAESSAAAALFFFRKTAPGQYAAYGLTATGTVGGILNLPGNAVTKADQSTVVFSGKEGYITGPENGAYFIWYPQLGSQVYVFNEKGNFLWEKDESHYLHVLPRGRFILAAAGDHSRMTFMNPDFKVQADFQGVLFTRFIADDRPELTTGQVCLSSLDGEVIVAHLDRRLYTRQKLGYALKSIACNFDTGDMAVIAERTVQQDGKTLQKDFLLRLKFDLSAGDDKKTAEVLRPATALPEIVASAELPVRTVTAAAITVTPETICFVQAAPVEAGTARSAAFYYTSGRKAAPLSVTLAAQNAAENSDTTFDQWKSATVTLEGGQGCLHAHRSGRLLIGNGRGLLLDRPDLGGERLLQSGGAVFIQNGANVYVLK